MAEVEVRAVTTEVVTVSEKMEVVMVLKQQMSLKLVNEFLPLDN